MIEDDKAPSSDWLNSKDLADKFFEDGKEFEKTKFGTFTVSLLLSALGATDKHVKTFLYPFIDAGLAKNTWPDQFAAIMIFSLTFEYFLGIEDEKDPNKIFPKEMNEKVDKILKKLSTSTNENPMVLYAIFHMVGNAAEDLNPLFFRYRGEKIIGSCLKMAKSPIQRVAENAITAFSNIISDIEEIKEERPDRINNYINIYLEVANH